MKTFTERLQYAMDERGINARTLARLAETSEATVSRWRHGTWKPNGRNIAKLADALGISFGWLAGENVPMEKMPIDYIPPEILKDSDVVSFPILGDVYAGYDHLPIETWDGEKITLQKDLLKGRSPSDFFALRVKGDSMYPVYIEGDIVLVLKQDTLNRSGEVGVIIYDTDYASLKKVEYVMGEDWMRLVPINPTHPPIVIRDADLEKCRVLGIPKLLIREIEQ